MKKVLAGLFLTGVVLALTGCGVSGRWTMESVKPEGMEKEFALKCMCLMDDGTYQACAKEGADMKMLKGTYKYDANAKTLTFTTDGKERKYNAQVQCPGGEMKIWGAEKGKEWTAMMKRQGACSKDCCAAGKCCVKTCDPAKYPAAKTEVKKEEPTKGDVKKGEVKKEEPKKDAPK
jgi:hypothetical protein